MGICCGGPRLPPPWLAPLYAFLASNPRGVVRRLPPVACLSLRYLEHSLADARLVPCARDPRPRAGALRVDAHAEGRDVGIGAWLPAVRADGTVDKWASPWLSVPLSPATAPWAFWHGADTYRLIASLEAFAIVLGIRCLVPSPAVSDTTNRLTVVPCLTDNKGNGSALTKLFSSRFPLSAIVMELGGEL